MKKLIALVLALMLIVSLCACDDQQFQNDNNQLSQNGNDPVNTGYKLTVIDYWGYLVKPLNDYYKAGEEVEVTLAFLSGPSVGIELNGEYIGEATDTKYDGAYPIITFTMPAMDSVLYTTQNGNIGFKSAFSRAGSGRDPDIWNNALNASKLNNSNPWNLPIYKFDTLADLEKFKSDFGGENGFNYGWDEVPSLNDVTKNYDEYFFERYTLMLVCIEANSGSYRFGFNDVTIDGNYFCIHIEQTNNPQVLTDDMASWFITVAIPDSMIENCTEFDANLVSNKLKEISSIADNSYDLGISKGKEIFYGDRSGFYVFFGKFSECIIVSYTDGTTENVKDALRNGHIQISDLDKYDIEYYVQSMSQMLSSIAHFSLSLDDLKVMVERYGENLTWSNFDRYYSYKTSSDQKTLYAIDNNYDLLISGDSTTSSPDYICLVYKGNMDDRIDVRYESIDEFVNANSSSNKSVPDDFSFALTWGTYGISSYDSQTGKLVKTTDATSPEDYITYYQLTDADKEYIYNLIVSLDVSSYPEIYDPQNGESDPDATLILTVRVDDEEKIIKAEHVSLFFVSEDEKGQLFLDTCNAISGLLTATDEWKALPDYENLYE